MSDALVCGYDEVGWGSIAGPLVVAGVIMPNNVEISSVIKDSKKFSSAVRRKEAYDFIVNNYQYDFRFVHPTDVKTACLTDNTHKKFPDWGTALRSATSSIVTNFNSMTHNLNVKHIVDGNLTYDIECLTSIPKADSAVAAVAAASIVAKILHDEYMINLQNLYTVEFGWERNKGYGTPDHIKAMNEHGVSSMNHRFNIQKVKDAYNLKGSFL